MYNNSYFNPFMYQQYNQAANLTRGIGNNIFGKGAFSNSISNTIGNSNKLSTLGKGLLGKFSFRGFLNGTSKTLNVVNQAIPIYYQVKPMFNNAKTMFRIMGAVKNDDKKTKIINNKSSNINVNTNTVNSNINTKTQINTNENISYQEENPTFFI